MLSLKQLEDVCLVHQGYKQCRYLDQDPADYNKWHCKKQSADKKRIDTNVDTFLQECKKKSIDPKTQGENLGNNCKGYPIFQTIEQGYDV